MLFHFLQGEDPELTKVWFQALQFYTQSLGGWRKRRKGLGHIVIDSKLVSPSSETPPSDIVDGATAAD